MAVIVIPLSFLLCLSVATPSFAQGAGSLSVAEATICIDVVDRTCQGADVGFSSNVGRLFCLTKIVGADGLTKITHVWYYKETERARVDLKVQSASWRTYSSKIIQHHEMGPWRVDVLGPDGTLLKAVEFQIVP
jgi:hypothetical protein